MLLPFQGALIPPIYPGRCPGLGASGLSARVNRTGGKFSAFHLSQHLESFSAFHLSFSLRFSTSSVRVFVRNHSAKVAIKIEK